jgi:ribosomal protein S18 acetylase RimI-like enzyme
MEIDDLARVYHLGEDLFTSDRYPFLYRTWDQWEVIGLFNTDAEYCLVAEIDGDLAGFALGTVISKASWTYGYLIWLGVDPKFQKRGVADRLVDKLVERMIEEGARYMLVDTDPRNTPAVRFFKRKGFGNSRDHVFLSMNLVKHERYGRLIARERDRERAEKAERQRSRKAARPRQPEASIGEPMLRPLAEGSGGEHHHHPPPPALEIASGAIAVGDAAAGTGSVEPGRGARAGSVEPGRGARAVTEAPSDGLKAGIDLSAYGPPHRPDEPAASPTQPDVTEER